jgi:hypothetical protein
MGLQAPHVLTTRLIVNPYLLARAATDQGALGAETPIL